MATKRIWNYTVEVHTTGGQTFTAQLANGAEVYKQLIHHEMLEIKTSESTITYVPYESVDYAVVTKTTQVSDYEDATCVETDSE